ncbi:hypothetical protein KAI92_01960 [Candidatus Parcubacteria bacterium]|nr:hypothetical protein [Candidatus Parcubacteria bacterium]
MLKQVKDHLVKLLNGNSVPVEYLELKKYFRFNEPINFEFKKEDGEIIAISTNFRHGSIITSAKTQEELDKNIEDAILTSFEVPSSYKKMAGLHKVGQVQHQYAIV